MTKVTLLWPTLYLDLLIINVFRIFPLDWTEIFFFLIFFNFLSEEKVFILHKLNYFWCLNLQTDWRVNYFSRSHCSRCNISKLLLCSTITPFQGCENKWQQIWHISGEKYWWWTQKGWGNTVMSWEKNKLFFRHKRKKRWLGLKWWSKFLCWSNWPLSTLLLNAYTST